MLKIITCMDNNQLIGKENGLPWNLPEDLKYFKNTTLHHKIVMGRKTYEGIGKPLPKRENIIITRNKELKLDGVNIVHSVDEVLELSKEEDVFVIGGSNVYEEFLPFADELYITKINDTFTGDAYFPAFNQEEFDLISFKQGVRNKENDYDYGFYVYKRKNN